MTDLATDPPPGGVFEGDSTMPLRLLVVSDIHGSESRVRRLKSIERDVTVVAGDIADCGGGVEEAIAIIEELAGQGPPVVWVPGNCDTPRLLEAEPPRNSYLVHGSCKRVGELCFAGAGGGTYSPFSTPFEMSDEELGSIVEKALSNAPPNTILVTHVPGYETGLDKTMTGLYVGSVSVRRIVEERKPLLHLCGHIHEAWGATTINGTLSVNPGPLFQGRYAMVFIEAEKPVIVARLYTL